MSMCENPIKACILFAATVSTLAEVHGVPHAAELVETLLRLALDVLEPNMAYELAYDIVCRVELMLDDYAPDSQMSQCQESDITIIQE